MSLRRFAQLLDTFGAEAAHWPVGERAAAASLLDSSPEARALRDRAARVDAALGASLPALDPAVLGRMRANLAAQVARRPLPVAAAGRLILERWLRPVLPAGCGALAVLAASGVWLVLATPQGSVDLAVAPPVLAMLEDGD
ncbi:hypothetical protein [Roseomonas sp. BN140053]|uniref:hypothetical protein n=1 Tax=Roseomonas sp. BN140053 TaxID=3391898 RepID=UPI0039ED41D3